MKSLRPVVTKCPRASPVATAPPGMTGAQDDHFDHFEHAALGSAVEYSSGYFAAASER